MKESTSRLRRLANWPDEITLVPFSGIQILDFGFSSTALPVRSRSFAEVRTPRPGQDDQVDLILFDDDERRSEALESSITGKEQDRYDINARAAFEPFLNEWVPVPVLRVKDQAGPQGHIQTDDYPSCWARMRVVALDEPDPDTGHDHRVQLALDTSLAEQVEGMPAVGPTFEDARQREYFALNTHPDQIAWFLRSPIHYDDGEEHDLQAWASDWTEHLFFKYRRRRYPKRGTTPADLDYTLEHWARYLTYLAIVGAAISPPLIRLTDMVAADAVEKPVRVDLVLDIGNNRTCGILTETFPMGEDSPLDGSYPVHLRDLCNPEILHEGLFASRVEFRESQFGPSAYTMASPNPSAFLWPSIVRLGPEAMALAAGQAGTETLSGLSSPKRYLWDLDTVEHDWRFHGVEDRTDYPVTAKRMMVELNQFGDVRAQIEAERRAGLRRARDITPEMKAPVIYPRFSRSSLYTFMLTELIAQVLVQINDPAGRLSRRHSEVPRMLEKIILTLPTAMPMQEQAIVRSRAEGALKLVWSMMGLSRDGGDILDMPELVVRWDEASCTQMVWLYSEIATRFSGQIPAYLELRGKPRKQEESGPAEPSLRVACIDIGGGTTDLMVMTYWARNEVVLTPKQTFREGFRVAGDDLVLEVGIDIVLPAIAQALQQAGIADVTPLMGELFGSDTGGGDQTRTHQRRQFGLTVIAPLATAILEQVERMGPDGHAQIDVGEVLNLPLRAERDPDADPDAPPRMVRVSPPIHGYLDTFAQSRGAREGWRLAELTFDVTRTQIDETVRKVFAPSLGLVGEAIAHLDADIVLLSGRPSRLPAIRDILEAQMIVTPDRLVTMHNYRTGGWYPYRDLATDQIGDPKSTVAMGGLLMTRARARIRNFQLETDTLRMTSTARHIGFMDQDGTIRDRNVLFRNVDLNTPPEDGEEKTFALDAPLQIGSRQLDLERWITTPLYEIGFTQTPVDGALPYTVTLERADVIETDEDDTYDHALQLRAQALREAFAPTEVELANNGRGDVSMIRFRLQTIGSVRDYWLESGVFKSR